LRTAATVRQCELKARLAPAPLADGWLARIVERIGRAEAANAAHRQPALVERAEAASGGAVHLRVRAVNCGLAQLAGREYAALKRISRVAAAVT
jgi:hypothetical protein